MESERIRKKYNRIGDPNSRESGKMRKKTRQTERIRKNRSAILENTGEWKNPRSEENTEKSGKTRKNLKDY